MSTEEKFVPTLAPIVCECEETRVTVCKASQLACRFCRDKNENKRKQSINWTLRFCVSSSEYTAAGAAAANIPNIDRQRIRHNSPRQRGYYRVRAPSSAPTHFICPLKQIILTSSSRCVHGIFGICEYYIRPFTGVCTVYYCCTILTMMHAFNFIFPLTALLPFGAANSSKYIQFSNEGDKSDTHARALGT